MTLYFFNLTQPFRRTILMENRGKKYKKHAFSFSTAAIHFYFNDQIIFFEGLMVYENGEEAVHNM